MPKVKVFKFGGASVNSAEAVKNMASIIKQHFPSPLVVVVSAMGKTTNQLEQLVPGILSHDEQSSLWQSLRNYHWDIMSALFPNPDHPVFSKVSALFDSIRHQMLVSPSNYNFDYDQTVSFGELISTTIISEYLNLLGFTNQWVDIRSIISTNDHYRNGDVDWSQTQLNTQSLSNTLSLFPLVVTQGFIASNNNGFTTTLGREGSDYSASVLSYCLNAESLTIWKDVDGFLNADPKFFSNTVRIAQIPYNEAIELSYYGASVIHPKTVKPLQNKGICLFVKSFISPQGEGSIVGPFDTILPQTPLYIFKNHQVLLSIMPKDFSFIAEDNLQTIFHTLAKLGVRVNLMQNSALSFSLCLDDNELLLQQLQDALSPQFKLRYNRNLQLITIRYYTPSVIDSIVGSRPILLDQRSRITAQLLVENP